MELYDYKQVKGKKRNEVAEKRRKLGFDFRNGKLTRVVRERAAIPFKRMVAMEALRM